MTIRSSRVFARITRSLLLAACLSPLAATANAASFYLQEQSVSGLGTAYAGAVADTEDASTVFYNPAGMTELDSLEFYVGGSILLPNAHFKNEGSIVNSGAATGGTFLATKGNDGGNPFNAEVVPHAYLSAPVLQDKLWLGVGISAPFGLANDYEDDFVGRYNSTENELSIIDLAPSAAWKVNEWLSIGGGANIQFAKATLKNAIPSPATVGGPTSATDGETRLRGDDVTTGYNLGFQVKPWDGTKIGVHYREGVSHTLEGTLRNVLPTNIGPSSNAVITVPGSAELDLPNILSTGISHKVTPDLTLLGSANWYEWSNFDDIPVNTPLGFSSTEQGYKNTWGFAFGGRYQLNDRLLLKAGVQYDQTPTVDEHRSTRIPDGNRFWLTTGATYAFTDQITLDLAGAYIDVSSETVDITSTSTIVTGTSVTTRTRGKTDGNVGIVSAALRFKF